MFGILALQGGFSLHQRALERVGIPSQLLKKPEKLEQMDGLIIPGGESTALLKLMDGLNWADAIATFSKRGRLLFGTCAGMILLSQPTSIESGYLGLIDIEVKRNAYGRQIDSFIGLGTSVLSTSPMEMVCIRAPEVTFVGEGVEVLARLDGRPMLLCQKNVVVATFHPELSRDHPFYQWLKERIFS